MAKIAKIRTKMGNFRGKIAIFLAKVKYRGFLAIWLLKSSNFAGDADKIMSPNYLRISRIWRHIARPGNTEKTENEIVIKTKTKKKVTSSPQILRVI